MRAPNARAKLELDPCVAALQPRFVGAALRTT
jgi:hypothetical protein